MILSALEHMAKNKPILVVNQMRQMYIFIHIHKIHIEPNRIKMVSIGN